MQGKLHWHLPPRPGCCCYCRTRGWTPCLNRPTETETRLTRSGKNGQVWCQSSPCWPHQLRDNREAPVACYFAMQWTSSLLSAVLGEKTLWQAVVSMSCAFCHRIDISFPSRSCLIFHVPPGGGGACVPTGPEGDRLGGCATWAAPAARIGGALEGAWAMMTLLWGEPPDIITCQRRQTERTHLNSLRVAVHFVCAHACQVKAWFQGQTFSKKCWTQRLQEHNVLQGAGQNVHISVTRIMSFTQGSIKMFLVTRIMVEWAGWRTAKDVDVRIQITVRLTNTRNLSIFLAGLRNVIHRGRHSLSCCQCAM